VVEWLWFTLKAEINEWWRAGCTMVPLVENQQKTIGRQDGVLQICNPWRGSIAGVPFDDLNGWAGRAYTSSLLSFTSNIDCLNGCVGFAI